MGTAPAAHRAMPPHAPVGVQVGEVIGGKYRIDRFIGSGSMGVVVGAHHLQLDQRVAIKFLSAMSVINPNVVARFAREARAAAKITSQHVARVIDVGALENGAPYIVMEYLEGSDLAAWVRERGPLPVAQAVDFVLQGCEAIAEAHGLGIIHRDLKPANFFVSRSADGQYSVKVLDFGISKVTGSSASPGEMTMTSTQTLLGSPLYMSPEQMVASRDVDEGTDIWSLGVILHELLTGHPPFNGDSVPEVCIKVATQEPAPLRFTRSDCPRGLEAVMRKCLEKDRSKRYAIVADLAEALVEYGSERGWNSARRISRVMHHGRSPLTSSPPRVPALSHSGPALPWARTAHKFPASNRVLLAGVLLLVLSAGTAVALLARSSHPPTAARTSAEPVASAPPVAPSGSVETRMSDDGRRSLVPLPEPAPEGSERRSTAPESRRPPTPTPALRPAARVTPAVDAGSVAAPSLAGSSTPRRECDPPVTIDKNGIMHAKPECL
jgi:serine/threonine-protein kinase